MAIKENRGFLTSLRKAYRKCLRGAVDMQFLGDEGYRTVSPRVTYRVCFMKLPISLFPR